MMFTGRYKDALMKFLWKLFSIPLMMIDKNREGTHNIDQIKEHTDITAHVVMGCRNYDGIDNSWLNKLFLNFPYIFCACHGK